MNLGQLNKFAQEELDIEKDDLQRFYELCSTLLSMREAYVFPEVEWKKADWYLKELERDGKIDNRRPLKRVFLDLALLSAEAEAFKEVRHLPEEQVLLYVAGASRVISETNAVHAHCMLQELCPDFFLENE